MMDEVCDTPNPVMFNTMQHTLTTFYVFVTNECVMVDHRGV